MQTARLFISCVSKEFADYRDALRHDLDRPNLTIKVQEDFIAYGGATLEKLDEYIQHCDAVIHLCGDMTGSMANDLSLAYINKKYKDFGKKFPALQPVLEGKAQLSYTQWEAWLAAWHGKRLLVAAPKPGAARYKDYVYDSTEAVQQQSHLGWLREEGYYDEIHFTTADDLAKQLLRSKLRDILDGLLNTKPANLPYQTIGSHFKGREEDIKDLGEKFSGIKNTVAGIALYGLGGMGKTRLAVEYALAHIAEYTALLFVQAGEPELLTSKIAALAATGILNLPEHAAIDEDTKYAAVVHWLNEHDGWLLILDNADTPEATKRVEATFAQLHKGHVLITSRLDNWSPQLKKKPLELLKPEAAIAFLLETTEEGREKKADDNTTAASIANDLGYLALALEQARAYIVTKEYSLARYRKNWEANRAAVLEWFDEQQMQYPKSVAITWQTTFSQLSAGAITLLNRLSWMAPDPIPKSLLEIEVPDAEPIDTAVAWEELKKYSLAASAADKKTFSIHRLVQDITRSRMDKTLALQTLNEGLSWIDTAFASDATDVNNWPLLEPLAPHILSLLEYTKVYETGNNFTRLMNQAATLFYTKAQYGTAESLMRRALEMDEQSFGPNHQKVAIRLNNLAQLLQATNHLQEAEPLMRRVLEIDEQTFGANHPEVAIDLNNLATLLQDTNRFPEAEPLLRKALEIGEQSFGPNHPKVALRLNNLAQLLKATSRLQEAEPLMRRALEIDKQSFGSNHPDVARDLNNLAQLLEETNRLDEAEPLMRRALEIDEQSFGSNHPKVAIRLNNLAQLLQHTNRLQEAEPLMKRSLIIFLKSLGNEHPNTETVGENYIMLLQKMGKSEEEIKAIL